NRLCDVRVDSRCIYSRLGPGAGNWQVADGSDPRASRASGISQMGPGDEGRSRALSKVRIHGADSPGEMDGETRSQYRGKAGLLGSITLAIKTKTRRS